ncbi:DHBP synthase RibB-like alpha/beta domain-containing protein [Mortierella sp. GBAus27b]|nr:DHBP synthase RibB-like alpha/beta domain-containing protein [Mortierella sp. GBAus27b]
MPTETVYGLAANALDSVAAQTSRSQPSSIQNLLARTLDAPVSKIQPDPGRDYLWLSNRRRPASLPPITRALIWACGLPLAAPSANSSGKPSPTLASHVMDDLHGKILMVINGGQCSFGIESTVVDGLRVPPAILRPGDATFEQLREVLGMQHYSPEAEVVLVEYIRPPETTQGPGSTTVSSTSSPSASSPSAAAVSSTPSSLSSSSPVSSPSTSTTSPQHSLILKEIENLRLEGKKRFGILRTSFTSPLADTTGPRSDDVARELFRGLRHLDGMNVDCIFVEGISDQGEGLAVMNRLRKAASRTISLGSATFL